MTHPLPRAMLIDMDDTILSAYSKPEAAWLAVAQEFEAELAPLLPTDAAAAIAAAGRRFWQTAEAHWRLKLNEARYVVVADGFATLAAAGKAAMPREFCIRIADRYSAYREEQMVLFPGVHEAIDGLKTHGVKLALVTNGAAETQRAKVVRFALANRFDHIQIEGEHGFGKPDERAYLHAMDALGVTACDTWMIGDNLEWEVVTPQRLGIYAIWMDAHGDGLPEGSSIKPDRIIRSLSELLPEAG
jgi:putative hydrolase of the HAD superfamily